MVWRGEFEIPDKSSAKSFARTEKCGKQYFLGTVPIFLSELDVLIVTWHHELRLRRFLCRSFPTSHPEVVTLIGILKAVDKPERLEAMLSVGQKHAQLNDYLQISVAFTPRMQR